MTSRRHFISATSAAFAASSFHIFGADPAKKYRTALIGCGWWGMNILKEAIASGRVKVCALCDVHEDVATNSSDEVNGLNGDEPKLYKDYRELLDKEKPEIVIISTPDHWHALQSIAACKAGAHVYVEKPTGHTINESKAMVKAAREAGVVVQVGLHRRIGGRVDPPVVGDQACSGHLEQLGGHLLQAHAARHGDVMRPVIRRDHVVGKR